MEQLDLYQAVYLYRRELAAHPLDIHTRLKSQVVSLKPLVGIGTQVNSSLVDQIGSVRSAAMVGEQRNQHC
jgi:hypothetical protein